MAQTALDLIRKQANEEQQRLQQPSVYKDPVRFTEYDVGGNIVQFQNGTLVDTGRKGTAKAGEVIGLNSNTGKNFLLGEVSDRAPIQKNVNPKGGAGGQGNVMTGFEDLAKSAMVGGRTGGALVNPEGQRIDRVDMNQQALPTTASGNVQFDGTISGADKLAKYRDAGIMPTSTISQLGDVNFAEQLNLNPNMPTRQQGQSDLEYQNNVLTWKVDNLSTTYNAVMEENTKKKLFDMLQNQGDMFKFTNDKTLNQRIKEMEADSEFKNAKTEAFQFLDSTRDNRIKTEVDSRMMGVKGTEKVRNKIREKIQREVENRVDQDIKQKKNDIESATKDAIKQTAQQAMQSQQKAKEEAATPMTIEQQNAKLKENMIKAYMQKINPKTGLPYNSLQATAEVEKIIKAYGTEEDLQKQNYSKFSDAIAGDTTLMQDPVSLFETAQVYADTNADAYKLIETMTNSKVAKDARNAWLENQGFNAIDVDSTETKAQQQSNFIDGKLTGGMAVDYMNNLEIDSPEKAKRVYEKVLETGAYEDDPVMESLVRTRLSRMGGGSSGLQNTMQAVKDNPLLFGGLGQTTKDKLIAEGFVPPIGASLTENQRTNLETGIMKSFDSGIQEAKDAGRQVRIMNSSLDAAKKAFKSGGDINAASQGILVTFQKILDPTSVVRESEYARSGDGQSLLQSIEGKYQQIKQGGAGVTLEGLQSFVDMGNVFLQGYEQDRLNQAIRSERRANQYGLDTNIIFDPETLKMLDKAKTERANVDANAVDLIKNFEGFRANTYLDQGGVPTIGYGFTTINGQPVTEGMTITQEEADAELARQIENHKTWEDSITTTLTPEQESALTSFTFNLGANIWNTDGGKQLAKLINNREFEKAKELVNKFNQFYNQQTQSYEVSQGLTNRRLTESQYL